MAHMETAFARSRKPEQGLRERPSAACRAEALDLLATAETLTAANPKLGATTGGSGSMTCWPVPSQMTWRRNGNWKSWQWTSAAGGLTWRIRWWLGK
jgi:hypothetical protein